MASPSIRLKNPALHEGSIVLVTGANGYIASHTCNQLLAAGYKVRGTVRDVEKNQWLQSLFDQRYGVGKFTLVQVERLDEEGAFDDAIKDVDGVCHIASDVSLSPDARKVIDAVVQGTTNCMRAAASEQSVKRFVYTSSSTAVYTSGDNGTPAHTVGQTTYSDSCVAYVQGLMDPEKRVPHPYPGRSDSMMIYAASKALAEKEVWRFAEANSQRLVVNTVIPNVTFGAPLDPAHRSSTAGLLLALFQAQAPDDKGIAVVRSFPPKIFVHVQDVARLHVAALLGRDVQNQRLFAFSAPYNWNVVLDIYRQAYPDRRFVDDFVYEGSGMDETDFREEKRRAAEAMASVGYDDAFGVALEDIVKATIASFVEAKRLA